jgi:hypothetical protein
VIDDDDLRRYVCPEPCGIFANRSTWIALPERCGRANAATLSSHAAAFGGASLFGQ